MSDKPRPNAMHSIPDDPDASTYRFIIVSAKRARQLQNGQRSVWVAGSHSAWPPHAGHSCFSSAVII